MLKIKNDYEAFCVDEASLYVYQKWLAGEKTYIEKVMKQNRGLRAWGDKVKKGFNNRKNKMKNKRRKR